MKNNDIEHSTRSNFGWWLIVGICLGLVYGVALDNIPLGIALGPSFGILLWTFQKDELVRKLQTVINAAIKRLAALMAGRNGRDL